MLETFSIDLSKDFGWIAAIIAVVLGIVEKSGIKWNPYSVILKAIGRGINGEMLKKIEDIEKNLSNFVTYNDRGVGEIYAPSLLVVSKDEVLLFDSDTSFVKGEITPSTYWNSITQNEKEQELREIFTKYLNN